MLCAYNLNHIKGETYYKLRSKTKFHIKDVLVNYWDSFVSTFSNLKIRNVVHEEVEKVIKCRTIELGYTYYECKHCHNYSIVPHTCKSRFCSSCGNKYLNDRLISSKTKLLKEQHRHIVFTIPDVLRNYFLKDRSLLDLLYDSVNETITWIFNPKSYQNRVNKQKPKERAKKIIRVNKDSCLVPGYICVLHTYGRDLKWNPHIHMLISEGGLTNSSMKFKSIKHFNYESLRKTFQKILLDKLYNHFGTSFYKIKCELYKKLNNGFYVYAHKKQFTDIKKGIEYILRYSSKPAMAESRITSIDYKNDTITYWYDDHKTNKRIIVTEHPFEFIAKLIRHIPNRNFKMIRYYGIYAAKNHKYQSYINKMFKLSEIRELKAKKDWRNMLISTFKFDPLVCDLCGHMMKIKLTCIPIYGKENKWHEIKYSEPEEFKPTNWEHFKRYCPTKY